VVAFSTTTGPSNEEPEAPAVCPPVSRGFPFLDQLTDFRRFAQNLPETAYAFESRGPPDPPA
jgi:hypothetical protein